MTMTTRVSTVQSIALCISQCANARDGRGRWRQMRALQADLLTMGCSPVIAEATALAAGRVGEHIAQTARSMRIASAIDAV